MKTFNEWWKDMFGEPDLLQMFHDSLAGRKLFQGQSWDACLKEVAEELRNIVEYKGNDIDESVVTRVDEFCKKIFEETHA